MGWDYRRIHLKLNYGKNCCLLWQIFQPLVEMRFIWLDAFGRDYLMVVYHMARINSDL